VPNVASTLVWQWLFQPVYGVVNWLLTAVRIFGNYSQHDWLAGLTQRSSWSGCWWSGSRCRSSR
jgi:ABC-type sugar transport system permease subunit